MPVRHKLPVELANLRAHAFGRALERGHSGTATTHYQGSVYTVTVLLYRLRGGRTGSSARWLVDGRFTTETRLPSARSVKRVAKS